MFKKPSSYSLEDRIMSNNSVKNSVESQQHALLNFVLAHAQNDERPYLEVSILGKPILGLLDSGASRTIAGQSGCELLQQLGCLLQK